MEETGRSVAASRPEQPPVIVLAANSAWNLINFRSDLIRSLVAANYRVIALAPGDGHELRLAAVGAEFTPIAINSSGVSIFQDLSLLNQYRQIMRRLRPAAFLGFTVKPNIYGSLAARLEGVSVINNISGLGTAFLRRGPLQVIVSGLYRLALRKSATIFFQNADDKELFVQRRLADPARARLLPGSGINLDFFKPEWPDPARDAVFRFLLVARLLWDKGIAEYVEAARIVRLTHPTVRFQMLGSIGADNRSAVPSADVERWRTEGVIVYLGSCDDVRPFLRKADCVVLPSYREGLPRSLLEASAMGKPLIATDVPGCRDVVDDGSNGFLCEVRSADSLAAAMIRMIELSKDKRTAMGRHSRDKVERDFDQRLVSAAYLEALASADIVAEF